MNTNNQRQELEFFDVFLAQGCGKVDSQYNYSSLLINAVITDNNTASPFPTPLYLGRIEPYISPWETLDNHEIVAIINLTNFEYIEDFGERTILRFVCIHTPNTFHIDPEEPAPYVLSYFSFDPYAKTIVTPLKPISQMATRPVNEALDSEDALNTYLSFVPYFNNLAISRKNATYTVAPNDTLLFIDEAKYENQQKTRASTPWFVKINDNEFEAVVSAAYQMLWIDSAVILETYDASGVLTKLEKVYGQYLVDRTGIQETEGKINLQRFLPYKNAPVTAVNNITLCVAQGGYVLFYDEEQSVVFFSEKNTPTAILWNPKYMPTYKKTPTALTLKTAGIPIYQVMDEPLVDIIKDVNGLRLVTADGHYHADIVEETHYITLNNGTGDTQVKVLIPKLVVSPEGAIATRTFGKGAIKNIENFTYYVSDDFKLYRLPQSGKDRVIRELTDRILPAKDYFNETSATNITTGEKVKYSPPNNLLPIRIKDVECLLIGNIICNVHTLGKETPAVFSALKPNPEENLSLEIVKQVGTQSQTVRYNGSKRITASDYASKGHFIALRDKLFYMPLNYDWDISAQMQNDPYGAVLWFGQLVQFDTDAKGTGAIVSATVQLRDLYYHGVNNDTTKLVNISMCLLVDGQGSVQDMIDNLYNDDYWTESNSNPHVIMRQVKTTKANEIFEIDFHFNQVDCTTAWGAIRYHTTTGYPKQIGDTTPYNEYLQKLEIMRIRLSVIKPSKPVNIGYNLLSNNNVQQQ